MNIDANLDVLKKDLAARIQKARARRTDDKAKATFVAVYIGLVSAITTVCIGITSFLQESYSSFFGIVSLVASASLTVVAAWDGIFKHKRLWINSAATLNELYELDTDIRHAEGKGCQLAQQQINELYDRYKRILQDSNERWLKIRE